MHAATAVSGILVALLLPAVQAAREAARRAQSMNNLKQLMLGLLNYESATGAFPAHANYSNDGKPLLSWRVHILPYLEQQALYDQFHLNEPWDSEHNKTLIAKMPAIYLDPSSKHTPADGRTHYLGVVGEKYAFAGTEKGRPIRSFSDGTSMTVTLVQVSDERATPWTKPDDWQPDAQDLLKGLTSSLHPGGFLVGITDGSVRFVSESIDKDLFKGMLTVAGGELITLP